MKNIILVIYRDEVIFTLLQFSLTLIFLYSLYHEDSHKESKSFVTRGEESRNFLAGFFATITSIFITQAILSSDFLNGYKVATITADIGITAYLCLLNGWFRNKLIAFYIKFTEKKEKF